jgi:branched-chain amino acid transport system permease protein
MKASLNTFLQHLVQGVALGSTYALAALGFSMQFAAMRLVNFAHGESLMLGAFVALALITSRLSFSFAAALLCSIVILGVIGICIERLAIRSLYGSSDLNIFVGTIGLSLILRQVGLLIFGADARPFMKGFGAGSFKIGHVTITVQQVGVLVCAVALMGGLEALLRFTRVGVAMRAVAQDESTAALMGINTARTKTLVYALSTSLAAAAGVLFASSTFAVYDMGLLMGIKGFTAAVFGGLGSLPGAMLGGLLLGVIDQLATAYVSSLYRDTISLTVLILVLLLLPRGLLGLRRGSPWGKV